MGIFVHILSGRVKISMSKNKKKKFNYDDDFFDYDELNYASNKKRQDRSRRERRKEKYAGYEMCGTEFDTEE